MALIECAECEATVSDRARACPRCGYPLAEHAEKQAVAPAPAEQMPPPEPAGAPPRAAATDGVAVNQTTTAAPAIAANGEGHAPSAAAAPAAVEYAGFWMRAGAFVVDLVLLLALVLIVAFATGAVLGLAGAVDEEAAEALGQIIAIAAPWLYFAGFESSARQATPGKQLLGLKVTDLDGAPISFARATGRHFGRFLSVLTSGIGYLMAGFTEKKQTLHDMMARCLVLKKG